MDTAAPAADATEPFAQHENGSVVLWVKAASSPHKVSGAVLKFIAEGCDVSARAIGAGSVNQALKGCAIARQVCNKEGRELQLRPSFETVSIEGNERTAMMLAIHVQ